MSFSRLLTCPRALSAVRDHLIGSRAVGDGLLDAGHISSQRLAGNQAGRVILAELIRRPVLKRVSACCKSAVLRDNVFCATKELTFVLIRVMPVHPLLV